MLLLSYTLPEAVPLPASAQPFFLQVFDKATQAPDVSTLKPIYHMLNGACGELLSLLSSEERHAFDQNLCDILKASSTGQNSMLLLWCFGIIILAEHPLRVWKHYPPPTGSDLHRGPNGCSENQWRTASGRKLFGSPYKAIQLAYLSVMFALKAELVPEPEAVECIRIATRTVGLVDQAVRERWPSSSPNAKDTFLRLPGKLLKKGIDAAVQFEVGHYCRGYSSVLTLLYRRFASMLWLQERTTCQQVSWISTKPS